RALPDLQARLWGVRGRADLSRLAVSLLGRSALRRGGDRDSARLPGRRAARAPGLAAVLRGARNAGRACRRAAPRADAATRRARREDRPRPGAVRAPARADGAPRMG